MPRATFRRFADWPCWTLKCEYIQISKNAVFSFWQGSTLSPGDKHAFLIGLKFEWQKSCQICSQGQKWDVMWPQRSLRNVFCNFQWAIFKWPLFQTAITFNGGVRFPGLRVPGSLGARQPLCPARLRTRGAAACVRGESGSWPRGAPASTVPPHIPGA